MSAQKDRKLGHADEADGIEEYDNALPTWWLGLFIFTVIWGVIYGVDYHFVSHRSQSGEYNAEVSAALAPFPQVASKGGELSEAARAGQEVFKTNCVGCHGETATGGVGPNLTDTTWIHGGKIEDITKVINEGVPDKGMLTWGPILGQEKVAQVAAYVHELGGGQ